MRLQDLTGQRFGRLVVIKRADNVKTKTAWLCKCDCGKEKIIIGDSLKRGITKSCGCLEYEARFGNKKAIKHGDKGKRLYRIYRGMWQRCYDKKCKNYVVYGARGIKICDEWLGKNGYIHFREWAMNNGYREDLSIDRKDNNKGYSPNNCRWATLKEQANNRRDTIYLTFNGETHCLTEWSEITKISSQTLKKRIKRGWDVADALTRKLGEISQTKKQ